MTSTSHEEQSERTCPGMHGSDRPPPKLRPDERLCRYCVGRTMRYLEDLAGDLAELDTTVARQARVRNSGTARPRREYEDVAPARRGDERPGAREQRLPFNPHASEIRADAETRILEWAFAVAEMIHVSIPNSGEVSSAYDLDTPAAEPLGPRCLHDMVPGTCAICDGLLDDELAEVVDVVNPPPRPRTLQRSHPQPQSVSYGLAVLRSKKAKQWMRTDEEGEACAGAIAWIRGRVRASVDRFDGRWYAGRCGLPTQVIDLVEVDVAAGEPMQFMPVVRDTMCAADLYAEPGKAVITCDGYREPLGVGGCGQLHPAVTRHKYVVRAVRERPLPLPAILDVALPLLGRRPNPETVKKWRQRGRLRPLVCVMKHWSEQELAACKTCRGELYLGGQVIDLIIDEQPRTGPKRGRREVRGVSA